MTFPVSFTAALYSYVILNIRAASPKPILRILDFKAIIMISCGKDGVIGYLAFDGYLNGVLSYFILSF